MHERLLRRQQLLAMTLWCPRLSGIHALCDLSFPLVGNPCPLRSVIPACRESFFIGCGRMRRRKDSGQARMTRKGEEGFCRFLTGGDRLSQNGQEIHALCDLSLSLVGNPCPLRSVIPACRESFFVGCGRIRRKDSGQARMTRKGEEGFCRFVAIS